MIWVDMGRFQQWQLVAINATKSLGLQITGFAGSGGGIQLLEPNAGRYAVLQCCSSKWNKQLQIVQIYTNILYRLSWNRICSVVQIVITCDIL